MKANEEMPGGKRAPQRHHSSWWRLKTSPKLVKTRALLPTRVTSHTSSWHKFSPHS
ncbi:rCG29131 [Rattus norvegicus]|uniref:RCG29131 n=1 Tax=Rattus norvegicus TaxID=10116 RepID=A6KS93_RAT|nr:rCG29131 [Rattus norvegicus]